MKQEHPDNVFARRMKEKRTERQISQRQLGIAAGIDEGVASTRINRYEVGVHSPDYLTAKKIADALTVPLAYLYCEDDQLAWMIERYGQASKAERSAILAALQK